MSIVTAAETMTGIRSMTVRLRFRRSEPIKMPAVSPMRMKNADISDYICTLPKADFRVSFHHSDHQEIYDLLIENSRAADPVSNVHVLYNYLKALVGPQPQNPY